MKTAIVIGNTGLVGNELVQLLLRDKNFGKVVLFGRRSTGMQHEKLVEHTIDFSKPDSWRHLVLGDVLFSALGTTIGKAGSQAKQFEVDYTWQYLFAEIAAHNGVAEYVLVSSMMAKASSSFFYLRMKGELEEAICRLIFNKIRIVRPAQLFGIRNEKRAGESFGLAVTRFLNVVGVLRNRKPIHGKTVAQAMINSLQSTEKLQIIESIDLFELAAKSSDL